MLVTTIEGSSEDQKRRIKRWAEWLSLVIPLAAVIIYLLTCADVGTSCHSVMHSA